MMVNEIVHETMPHAERTFHRFNYGGLSKRDCLSVDDFSIEELISLFELAADIKARPKRYKDILEGKTLGLIFEKPSLRTRTTFTLGIRQLGGECVDYPPGDIGLGKRESVYDVAKNLERMVDGVMIRTFGQNVLHTFAQHAGIPVINGLTDLEHPCQAMADFFTIAELRSDIRALKMAYVGDGNNVANSLLLMAGKWGSTFSIATPEGYKPDADIFERAQELAAESGGIVEWGPDPTAAVINADIVFTDTWTSMGQEAEAVERRKVFAGYQVNRQLFARAKSDALFMHCLPAHRGEEVTDEIIDSPNSVVYQEAENRLHVQKALLCALLGD